MLADHDRTRADDAERWLPARVPRYVTGPATRVTARAASYFRVAKIILPVDAVIPRFGYGIGIGKSVHPLIVRGMR